METNLHSHEKVSGGSGTSQTGWNTRSKVPPLRGGSRYPAAGDDSWRKALIRIQWAALLCILGLGVPRAEDSVWVDMFNGKDINDWAAKFQGPTSGKGLPLGVNPDNTFRVETGTLYAYNHLPYSETGMGHLFWKKNTRLSHYLVRAVYKFMGGQEVMPPDFRLGWNTRNNGLMVLGEQPDSIPLKQDFPISIEVQLLGGHTGNLCTPRSYVTYGDVQDYRVHCTGSTYPDAWKGTKIPWESEWSDITVRVLSDSLIEHYIHGAKVMSYSRPRRDKDNSPMKDGSISIQAEGAPTQFKSIQLLSLIGCMDKSKPAYRTYFVKNDPAACSGTPTSVPAALGREFDIRRGAGGITVQGAPGYSLEVRSADGSLVAGLEEIRHGSALVPLNRAGVYLVQIRTTKGTFSRRVAWL